MSALNLITNPEAINAPTNLTNNSFSPSYWQIGTLNTQGLTDPTKHNLWFTFLSFSKFDIFIHTETNSNTHSQQFWQFSNFKTFWYNDNQQQTGSGIGISITTELAHHIYKKQQFHGRILSLDLTFPHKHTVRIIGVYLLPKGHKLRNACHQSITHLI
jgi:hypothetical protein